MDFGKLVVRLVVGGFFVGHGLQKLRGAFGGPGLEGTEQMMTALAMHPAKVNARAAALSETVGGAGIALGAGTPFAAAALIGTMATAVRKVHFKNGLWNSGGGWEYNAVLAAVVAGLTNDGPGDLSLDALIGRKRWGLGWGLFAVAAGLAGSAAAIEVGRRLTPPADEVAEEDASVSTDDPDEGATAGSADAAI
ncbi:DoxX family protein [Amnibacterium sp.]|uniref:DoxX family protein n=1 Tax=Amnibacterium sp. TaxID=1872496 RepID=UPI0026206D9C|nr:DoxX family protein [Amnibacterium sp.]MCU1474937.1 DoxX family protein [Amnibacterium sp.]